MKICREIPNLLNIGQKYQTLFVNMFIVTGGIK